MSNAKCDTISCESTATYKLSWPGWDGETVNESVCEPCGRGYVNRPSLKAKLEPLNTGDNTALNAAESVRKDITDPTLTVGDTVFCNGVYAAITAITLHAPWTHNASPIRNDWTAEEIITAEGSRWHGHAPDGPVGDVTD